LPLRNKLSLLATSSIAAENLHTIGGNKFGTVHDISLDNRTIDIKKRGDSAELHPDAVFAHKIIDAKVIANALLRLGEYVADHGIIGNGQYQAGRDLLLRLAPRIGSDSIQHPGETALEAALRIAPKLMGGVLPVQGPQTSAQGEWVMETFKAVNNGRLKQVPLPSSIDLLVPDFGRSFL
jgi:hypothetical protein